MLEIVLAAVSALARAEEDVPSRIGTSGDGDDTSSGLWFYVAVVGLIWYCAVLAHVLTGVWLVSNRARRPSLRSCDGSEGVTILRPLKGIDTEMDMCLRSALEQDYPHFEVIFCVEDESDPAIAMAQSLIPKYPNVDAKVMVGAANYGPNPKINNLAKGYSAAKYDLIWVLDSNVWVTPEALTRAVDTFRRNPKAHIVHHVPMCISLSPKWEGNMGSRLDEMFMLTAHAKFYTALNQFQMAPCVMGKSNLYRKSALDRAVSAPPGEGIRKFALYIAEDNMIAQALWDNGGRTAIAPDCAIQPLEKVPLSGYWDRRVRWLRVRRYMVLAATMLEPTTESLVCGSIGTFSITTLLAGHSWSWRLFLTHMLVWVVLDYWQFHSLISFGTVNQKYAPMFSRRFFSPEGPPGPRPILRSWLWVWMLREVLALPIWIAAMCGHAIWWRGRPFIIKKDLTAEAIR